MKSSMNFRELMTPPPYPEGFFANHQPEFVAPVHRTELKAFEWMIMV